MLPETCPDWICNQNGIPHDYVFLLTGIIIAIPYFILTSFLYKKYQLSLRKKLGCLFLLAVPIGYIIYSSILLLILTNAKSDILNFIGIVNYAPIMTLIITVPILLIGMVAVGFFMKFDDGDDDS